jgi:hypothetical protein
MAMMLQNTDKYMMPVMSELFIREMKIIFGKAMTSLLINHILKITKKLTDRELKPLSNSEARLDLRPRPV